MEEGRSVSKILTGEPTGKRLLRKRRWKDSFREALKEIGTSTRNWVDSATTRIIGELL